MHHFTITLEGTAPLLMHSARLSDPLDPATKALKEITSKRKKTDDDIAEQARREFIGGLYWDDEIGPYLPSDNIFRSLVDAAKKYRLGKKLTEGIVFETDVNPLAYNGPRTISGLWEDKNFVHRASVKVQTSRVMRTRPMFRDWAADATAVYDPNVIDLAEIKQIAETAGSLIGIGDWRPRFGRFVATIQETK